MFHFIPAHRQLTKPPLGSSRYLQPRSSIPFLIVALLLAPQLRAQEFSSVTMLRLRWAELAYTVPFDDREAGYLTLLADAQAGLVAEPQNSELKLWTAIIKSSLAEVSSPLTALSLAKEARNDLKALIDSDPQVAKGSAYSSLGILYHSVPGWPLGFGDEDKARELLAKGVKMNPEGMDADYFHALFLIDQQEYELAEQRLLKSQAATAEEGHELAHSGRHEQVLETLATLKSLRSEP